MMQFYRESKHKSSKERICEMCGTVINKGDYYYSQCGKFDGEFFSRDLHVHCRNMENEFCTKEFFIEGVESYMKCVTCRECGRVIQRERPSELVEQEFTECGEELEFTAKDIIGANKKFLGRYQEEFFCLKCLCEVLDCTPEALHGKIEAFKEQGCTLF